MMNIKSHNSSMDKFFRDRKLILSTSLLPCLKSMTIIIRNELLNKIQIISIIILR